MGRRGRPRAVPGGAHTPVCAAGQGYQVPDSELEPACRALLPSEPAFAERHNLSRETVARAYRLLRDAGAIKSRRGVGWFVSEEIPVIAVTVGPGSTISARPIRPGDVDTIQNPVVMLMTGSLIVQEPGKQPVAYDPMRTLIVVPGPARATRGQKSAKASRAGNASAH